MGRPQASTQYVLEHGHAGHEVELLKDQTDSSLDTPSCRPIAHGPVQTEHFDLSASRADIPFDRPKQSGFARAGGPDDTDALTTIKSQLVDA